MAEGKKKVNLDKAKLIYPGYYVTKKGNIYSTIPIEYFHKPNDLPRKLVTMKDAKTGYHRVNIPDVKTGKLKSHLVHRVVARAWKKNPHNKPCVNHLDGNKSNNHKNNLQWVTYKENMAHAVSTGLYRCWNKNLKPKIVRAIRKDKLSGATLSELCAKYNITSISIISNICNYKTYKDVK